MTSPCAPRKLRSLFLDTADSRGSGWGGGTTPRQRGRSTARRVIASPRKRSALDKHATAQTLLPGTSRAVGLSPGALAPTIKGLLARMIAPTAPGGLSSHSAESPAGSRCSGGTGPGQFRTGMPLSRVNREPAIQGVAEGCGRESRAGAGPRRADPAPLVTAGREARPPPRRLSASGELGEGL